MFARGKDKNLPDAHFEILASFRGYTLAILYSRFGSERVADRYILSLGSSPQLGRLARL
jgi:hypothetical protein